MIALANEGKDLLRKNPKSIPDSFAIALAKEEKDLPNVNLLLIQDSFATMGATAGEKDLPKARTR